MGFEFDEDKSRSNLEKHGIDFEGAQALWRDGDRVEIEMRTEVEPRIMLIGKIGEKIWSAIATVRGENTRIISVRRARQTEAEIYEKAKTEND